VSDAAPVLRVVRGSPDPAELAALTTVLLSLASAPVAAAKVRPVWAAPDRAVGAAPAPAADGWRRSALPR
jgi:hypothetical protein